MAPDSEPHRPSIISDPPDYDAVIVGGSLAGCATAIILGRGGAKVALVEKQPDPAAFKRICSHFIQASAVPVLERMRLLDPIMDAGAVRSRLRAWTQWGWIDPPPDKAGYAVNLRREILDPLIREEAAATPGVDLMLGYTAKDLIREGEVIRGVTVKSPDADPFELRGQLVVGADGRGSKIADLAGVETKTLPHNRFAYGGYFEGAAPVDAPTGSFWMLDPHWAAAFPTDSGLTFYAAMPTKERLPEFKADPEAALIKFVSDVPDPPPIKSGRAVEEVLGKIEMPNQVRRITAPGLALAGDAALTVDPLFGVGCGWALQSAEWLANSVAPALRGEEPLEEGLTRYRKVHRHELGQHAAMINEYATGRLLNPGERLLFAAAARDEKVAIAFDEMGTRRVRPSRMLSRTVPRAIAVNSKHALRSRRKRAATGTSPLAA